MHTYVLINPANAEPGSLGSQLHNHKNLTSIAGSHSSTAIATLHASNSNVKTAKLFTVACETKTHLAAHENEKCKPNVVDHFRHNKGEKKKN